MTEQKMHVLLVDDERISREVAAHLIRSGGYEVTAASLPSEAISLFTEHKDEYGVVVLDMLMPEMSGKELFIRLKEILPSIKAVLLSGYGKNADIQEAMDNGVKFCLQKPVTRQKLLDTIEAAAEGD